MSLTQGCVLKRASGLSCNLATHKMFAAVLFKHLFSKHPIHLLCNSQSLSSSVHMLHVFDTLNSSVTCISSPSCWIVCNPSLVALHLAKDLATLLRICIMLAVLFKNSAFSSTFSCPLSWQDSPVFLSMSLYFSGIVST